jgi:hypothetical protein
LSGINVVAAFTVIYLRILPENVLETRPWYRRFGGIQTQNGWISNKAKATGGESS